MERRGDQLPTLNQMRAVSEALKGVEQACDITRAKPEFVEFIRTCHPASILALLNQHAALVEQRDRLLRLLRPVTSPTACYCAVMKDEKCWHCEARELIATVEQGEGWESRDL